MDEPTNLTLHISTADPEVKMALMELINRLKMTETTIDEQRQPTGVQPDSDRPKLDELCSMMRSCTSAPTPLASAATLPLAP
ncbi:MAG TPA: hypothetical protein VK963_01730 [Candidatus Saccharimonadales bacterium]|nr:hypothetical protein [Candidatus Saccharimonadales bacterium]